MRIEDRLSVPADLSLPACILLLKTIFLYLSHISHEIASYSYNSVLQYTASTASFSPPVTINVHQYFQTWSPTTSLLFILNLPTHF